MEPVSREPAPLSLPLLDRLSTKIAVVAVIFLFALAGAVTSLVQSGFRRTQFSAYASSQQVIIEQASDFLISLVTAQARLLETQLHTTYLTTQGLAGFLGVTLDQGRLLEPAYIQALFQAQLDQNENLIALYFLNSQGVQVAAAHEGAGRDQEPPRLNSSAGQGPAVSWAILPSRTAGGPDAIRLEVPVLANGQFQGVITADMVLAHLPEQLEAIDLYPGAAYFLVDEDGGLVAYAEDIRSTSDDWPAITAGDLPLDRVISGQSGTETLELNNQSMLLAYASLQEPGWSLALLIPVEALAGQAEQMATSVWNSAENTISSTLTMVMAFFLLGMVATLVLLDRLFNRRVATLVAGVRAITAGNLNVAVPQGSPDELGILADAFNRMTAELRRRNDALLRANTSLQHSEERYRTLAHNFPNGAVLLYDHGLRHTLADGAGLEEIGLSRERLEGSTIWDVFPLEICALLEPHYRDALKGRESTFELPFAGRTYLVWTLPVHNERGQVTGGMVMTQNITERVQAQQILEQRIAESTYAIKQLYEQSETRNRELEILYQADEQLYRHLQVDQVLQALVDVVIDRLGADKAVVQVWEPSHQRLEVRAVRGYTEEMVRRMSTYRPGDGIAGSVFEHEQVYAVEDMLHAPPPADEIAAAEGIRSTLCVPIRVNSQVFGVFGMDFCYPQTFTPEMIRLFLALSQRAAIAVENARLYEQAEQAATYEERQRLARELHDAVTQSLYSLVLLAEAGRRYASAGNLEQVVHHISRLGETAQQALKEMRLLVYELRPLTLTEVGLAGAIRQRLDAVEKRAGIQAQLFAGELPDLPQQVEEQVYRIVQEALNNILKHARAQNVDVYLRSRPDFFEAEVSDDGQGFSIQDTNSGGIGMESMRERAEHIGGRLQVESTSGAGTIVRVQVPLEPASRLPVVQNQSGK